jgi:2-oxoglutarate ferredoxin oxidoreductase subunit beta
MSSKQLDSLYENPYRPNWCPGCGNYIIIRSLIRALSELNINPGETVLVSGIGCGSRLPYHIRTNGIHTLHGRPIPTAIGIKIARPDLNVIVVAGDGDTYGIGVEHFIHAMRSNIGITLLIQNNGVFGLTKGQPSPTAPKGFKGTHNDAFNPILHALSAGGTFISRGWTGDPSALKELIKSAIEHSYIDGHGISLVDILQLCIIYNPRIDGEFFTKYYREKGIYLNKLKGYDPSNKYSAFELMIRDDDRVPLGIIYHRDDVPSLEDELNLKSNSPIGLNDINNVNVSDLIEKIK